MKKEGTIGAATVLAIAAMVGVSLQNGPRQEGSPRPEQSAAISRSKPPESNAKPRHLSPACRNLEDQLEQFLDTKGSVAPEECYAPDHKPDSPKDLAHKTRQLKFVIALLPDPVHTHQPVLFDQFTVAIQEGAQDEKYDFDSSWLPWEDEDQPYALLADQKAADSEKERKENQPGIILFRKSVYCPSPCKEDSGAPAKNNDATLLKSYREGLIVFVVGEDATQGIHTEQFRNALAWIAELQEREQPASIQRLAILGPTFSGSFPSLEQVLSERKIPAPSDLPAPHLAIYSGSVSGKDAARAFQNTIGPEVVFHSFVQNDDEILRRFCQYIRKEQPGFDPGRVAIISEDETAYGNEGMDPANKQDCPDKALKLYYPRDISALRGAYQTKSLFDAGTSPQPAGTQKRSLPTDLADPTGKVQDSIHSYGGNQTPLSQEAFLLQIVAALRELNARYILLRSSNTLDQVFLTNFLRRGYPDGRIVVFGSDLMFIRERGTTGLGGTMTLSTYPLFPLERDWTEHQSLPAADRVFSSDGSEGTYVAFRLLLNDKSLNETKTNTKTNTNVKTNANTSKTAKTQDSPQRCYVLSPDPDPDKANDKDHIFLPSIACEVDPIPDYSPPFWTLHNQCGEMKTPNTKGIATKGETCYYPGPATWLSVIGANRLWPMASLTSKTPDARPVDPRTAKRANQRKAGPGGRPEMPLGMKVFLLVLIGFSLFHAWCCWSGSYTDKPAFLAHFASLGDWRHTLLVFLGSFCVASLAIVTGWGCGVFSKPVAGLAYPWFALVSVFFVCLMAWLAILLNNRIVRKLSRDVSSAPEQHRSANKEFDIWNSAALLFPQALFLLGLLFVLPLEHVLLPENRVLAYWRSMHLASGVSPIVPILLVFAGMYLSFWFTLHGLALFGPDRPCLPPKDRLALKDVEGKSRDFLRMFSQEDAAKTIEQAARPFSWMIVIVGAICFGLFLVPAYLIVGGVPVRSLGAENYAIIFLVCLDICCTLAIVETWRLCKTWDVLKRLLAFLDRLPLRRTMAALRGFSWGGVWKMSGNVLEVRYKVMSRQLECMNHTIASLGPLTRSSDRGTRDSLAALLRMRRAGGKFAEWYSGNYDKPLAGDLRSFSTFQQSIASASGTLLAKLLVPYWRQEENSLLETFEKKENDEAAPPSPPLADDEYIRNAEEFVCLNYLGFVQNVLGRLRTMTLTVTLLLIVATVATSTYPFDPQRALSAVFIVVFLIVGVMIVQVYASMHRDSTLSNVTNTKPGELGMEFWFKILGFGFAPLLGLLARIFPGLTDFIFSWLQPGIASLK